MGSMQHLCFLTYLMHIYIITYVVEHSIIASMHRTAIKLLQDLNTRDLSFDLDLSFLCFLLFAYPVPLMKHHFPKEYIFCFDTKEDNPFSLKHEVV